MLRHGRFQPRLGRGRFAASGDPYGRVFLADAATGLLASGFTYTRSGPDLWCPQADGSLASFAANVIPREWANGRWGFRFDPGWAQSFLQSHLLNNAAWGLTGLQTPTKTALGPNGANDSWALTETTAAATGTGGGQGISCVSGQAYTIKAVVSSRTGNRFFGLVFTAAGFGGNLAANINPADGTVTVNSGSITAGSRQLANGNWEFWATATATATGSFGILFRLSTAQTNYFPNYTGDGVSGVNVHALNLTNTAYPVPLAVAQGTAVTIGAANCTALLSALGMALGTEYTAAVDYTAMTTAADRVVMGLSSGAFANSIYIIPRNFSAAQSFSMLSGGTPQLEGMSTNAAGIGERQRAVLRAKANDSRAAVNGILAPQDAACVLPVGLTNIRLAGAPWGGPANDFSGLVHGLWLVPAKALNDTQVQDLSRLTLADVGAVSILDSSTKFVRPGLSFSRAAEVYEPQADGSLVAYSGAQVPWGANGVRLDPGWVNYATNSTNPAAVEWIKNQAAVVAVAAPSPLGVGTAYKLVGNATLTGHAVQTAVISATSGQAYSAVWLVKPAELTQIGVAFTGAGAVDRGAVVDLSTRAIVGQIGPGLTPVVTALADGWVMVSLSETAPGAGGYSARLYLAKGAATAFVSDGVEGVLLAGANHTNTSYPVPFTVAQGSAVAVPNPSLQGLLADIGALGDKYTIGVTYIVHGPVAGHVLRVDDGTDNSRSLFYANGVGALSFAVKTAGATVYNQSAAAPNGSVIKSVARVEANSTRVANNALLAAASGAMAVPAAQSWLRIGRADGGANVPSVTVVAVWYLPTSGLSDAQLQALSTL